MPKDRLSLALSAMASVDGDAANAIDRVCAAAVRLLGLSGCGISLMVEGRLRGSTGASEAGIAAVQELQLELGEGPCIDAWAGDAPVLEPDLAAVGLDRWPAFSRAALEAGVQAVFAFPMHQGAIRIGALVMYRADSGTLSGEEYLQGIVLADVASQVVLALQAGAPGDQVHRLLANEPPHWAEVHQATGMVSAQLGVSVEEAFVRLRAHAFAERQPLRVITGEVVARRLRLGGSS